MTMHDYIYQQPEVLARIVSDRKAIAGEAARFMAEHKPDSICLIASGTSRNAALTASYFMEDVLGIPVTVRAAAAKGHFFGSSLAVFISQSGNSTNTIAAAEKCPVPSFAITGNESGRLNTICSHHILMPCGPEDVGPKTKGYTATIAVLYVLALEAALLSGRISASGYDEAVSALMAASDALKGNIERAEKWTEANSQAFMDAGSFYLVGKDQDYTVAAEGALKIMETLLVPAAACEFEEYLHGPTCSLEKSVGGIYLLPSESDPDRGRIERLMEIHAEKSGSVFAVTEGKGSTEGRTLVLEPAAKWYARPFSFILPLQLISDLVPIRMGIEGKGSERFHALDAVLDMKYKG